MSCEEFDAVQAVLITGDLPVEGFGGNFINVFDEIVPIKSVDDLDDSAPLFENPLEASVMDLRNKNSKYTCFARAHCLTILSN